MKKTSKNLRACCAIAGTVLAVVTVVAMTSRAQADVKLHGLFSDNMILQRNKPVRVWGTASANEKIIVSFGPQTKSAQADVEGNWRVTLAPMRAAVSLQLTVKGNNEIILKNVAVGDVYVCSGQSNMEWPLRASNNAVAEIAAANYPNIRLFTVPKKVAGAAQKELAGPANWQICTPQSAPGFSAVGYFFGRELHQKLGVPIGLINSSWGGTIAQAWVSRDTLLKRDDLRDLTLQTEKAGDVGNNPNQPTVLFNGMIAPLVPFAVRGVIWYQGESNAGNPKQYQTLFPDLIRDWRTQWNAKQDGSEFGFYFVQLANFMARVPDPVQSGWAELREAQTQTLRVPRTGMATILDIGDAADIHPRNKHDVGKRLALAALATEYGWQIEYSGPTFGKMEAVVGKPETRIRLTHAQGLRTTDGAAPRGFALLGEDGKWRAANARIEGETIVLWNDEVAKATAVRYAWANNPDVNLVNAAGLPAVSFRTDVNPA